MSIDQVDYELAQRIPELARDSFTNNEILIAGMLRQAMPAAEAPAPRPVVSDEQFWADVFLAYAPISTHIDAAALADRALAQFKTRFRRK